MAKLKPTRITVDTNFLIWMGYLTDCPFNDSSDIAIAASELTKNWVRFARDWQLSKSEMLEPFGLERHAQLSKSEIPGLILVHLLIGLGISLDDII